MGEIGTEKKTDKKVVERSAAYPGYTLEEVIEFTQTLRKNLGSTSFSRESAAQALGHANLSGSAQKKTAACVHFGMLTREGNTYRQSELADQYFNWTSEDERSNALKLSVQKPALYGKLISEFNGKSLPVMLDNVLIRKFGITEKVGSEVAKGFRTSAEYAGVLVNGVINLDSTSTTPAEDDNAVDVHENPKTPPHGGTQTQKPDASIPSDTLPVTIPGTDVTIMFPISYAYDLSVGTFSEGIKALEKSIKKNQPVVAVTDSAESDTPAEI